MDPGRRRTEIRQGPEGGHAGSESHVQGKLVPEPSSREQMTVGASPANGFEQADALRRLEVLFSQVRSYY